MKCASLCDTSKQRGREKFPDNFNVVSLVMGVARGLPPFSEFMECECI